MSNLSRAQEVELQFHHLAQSGAYAEALDLVTREAHVFSEHAQKVVYSWRMTMACRLNEKDLGLRLLKEAIQHWLNMRGGGVQIKANSVRAFDFEKVNRIQTHS
jgi:hypothetical protein